MMFLRSLLELLDAKLAQAPLPYGLFHIVSLALSVLAGIGLCLLMKKPTTQQVRRVVLGVTLAVILLEIYKQINYTFQVTETGIEAEYQWYIFPWQFCSTPMYVGLLAALTKGKLHKSACAYLASFSLFAGLAVMFYPTTVFVKTIGINIQTMVCHGTMITLGLWLLGTGYVRAELKTVLKAIPVFAVMVGIAVILNEWAYRVGIAPEHFFNMFYVSPYCDPHLPVYSLIQPVVPFPWCLVLYILGFGIAACVPVLLALGVQKLSRVIAHKRQPAAVR